MGFKRIHYFLITLAISFNVSAFEPDFSAHATLENGKPRSNIYRLNPNQLERTVTKGQVHAMNYPVTVTGLHIPYEALKNTLRDDHRNPIKKIISKALNRKFGNEQINGLYNWLGLNPFNEPEDQGIYKLPYPGGRGKPDFPMGVSLHKVHGSVGMTFSCTACHSQDMFGKTIFGLTNKRSRANHLFVAAKKSIPLVSKNVFRLASGADRGEVKMFQKDKKNIPSVGVKMPAVLGLDTSLAQVALSLARRKKDAYATKSRFYELFPRKNPLEKFVADSKPAVWWNLKYKTRWLSDGSIVAGNPIFTNFLWNELGRGTDLKKLESWMKLNKQTIKELTAAVFATAAPKWKDVFDESLIDVSKARRGEAIFKRSCQRCHGQYEKNWDESIYTTNVFYHKKTPVKRVGTDPNRYLGMQYFADDLNALAISKAMKTVVKPTRGYVPPPLEAIWLRYPYLHNNSLPNLCALVTPPTQRVKSFYQGPAKNRETDFDYECVGYPVGDKIPSHWKKEKEAYFDTTKSGLRNIGHYKMFLDRDGNELYSWGEKMDLIEFLKTL